jgi:hypothetical protein
MHEMKPGNAFSRSPQSPLPHLEYLFSVRWSVDIAVCLGQFIASQVTACAPALSNKRRVLQALKRIPLAERGRRELTRACLTSSQRRLSAHNKQMSPSSAGVDAKRPAGLNPVLKGAGSNSRKSET